MGGQGQQVGDGKAQVGDHIEDRRQAGQSLGRGQPLHLDQAGHQAQPVAHAEHHRAGHEHPRRMLMHGEGAEHEAGHGHGEAERGCPVGTGVPIQTPGHRLDEHAGQRGGHGHAGGERDPVGGVRGADDAGQQGKGHRGGGEHPGRHRRHDPHEPGMAEAGQGALDGGAAHPGNGLGSARDKGEHQEHDERVREIGQHAGVRRPLRQQPRDQRPQGESHRHRHCAAARRVVV
jgi:hypothetical protein